MELSAIKKGGETVAIISKHVLAIFSGAAVAAAVAQILPQLLN
jgi:hypothetical protein